MQLYEVNPDCEGVTPSVIEDGSVFGEMALTGQGLHGLYARAISPSGVVSLRLEAMTKPEVGLRLVRELAQGLHDSGRR